MRALALVTVCALAAGCAQQSAQSADSGQIAPDNAPCEATLDAIGFTCTDGLEFSVRHDPDTQCVVLFLSDNTLVLPYDQASGANTNGAVTFEQRASSATLSRITSGAASQCEMVE